MIYFSDEDLIIRILNDSDIKAIVDAETEQGVQVSPEKYHCWLKGSEKFKNFPLIAKYKGEIAGYVNALPFSCNGPFNEMGYSEIVDLKVFDKYKNFKIEEKLMDIAEIVAADYSNFAFLSVKVSDVDALNKYIKRGYVPNSSGMWYKDKVYSQYPDHKIDDNLVLWLCKKVTPLYVHKLLMPNTPEYPFLRWCEDKLKTVYVKVNNKKSKDISVYDDIILEDIKTNDSVVGTVTFKHEYDSLENLFKAEGVKKILPFLNDDDVEEGVNFVKSFHGADFDEKFGCVAFGFKILEMVI